MLVLAPGGDDALDEGDVGGGRQLAGRRPGRLGGGGGIGTMQDAQRERKNPKANLQVLHSALCILPCAFTTTARRISAFRPNCPPSPRAGRAGRRSSGRPASAARWSR